MSLSWAVQKRLSIVLVIVAAIITLGAVVLIPLLYESPSCTDGKQNRDERGVDCGGEDCPYLCASDLLSPSVRFVRPLTVGARTDVIAFIDNRNALAEANDVGYTLELFDTNGVSLGTREGTVDLPTGTTIPLFVPGVAQVHASRAFLTLEPAARFSSVNERTYAPLARGTRIEETISGPRVTATIVNERHTPFYNVKYVVVVYDTTGTIIAASQTVVTLIPADGSTEAVFTWPTPFNGTASRVEILPLLSVR